MPTTRRTTGWMLIAGACSLVAMTLFSTGCTQNEASAQNEDGKPGGGWFAAATQVPAGTPIEVRLTSTLSSEDTPVGGNWTGVTTAPVVVDDKVVFATGSTVQGTVVGAVPAKRGDRAMLELEVTRVDTKGVHANSEPVIAGSPRARNLGAIAGGAAAGALIGKAVGGDGKDAAIGGLLGGAAATGAVAASKGYQVVLKSGTVMTFTTREQVAVR